MNGDPGFTTNIELLAAAKKHNIKLDDVLNKDLMYLLKPKKNNAYIINLADSTRPGTHWICVYTEDNECVYFDSFGQHPPLDVIAFISRIDKNQYQISTKDIQSIDTGYCGQYCLAFLLFMQTHKRIPLKKRYNKFLGLFDKDTSKNLNLLKKYLPFSLELA